ncbi:MAG: dipeptide epimerase [Chloroflexota bacterium]
MKLTFEPLDLMLEMPFTIARGTSLQAENVLVQLESEGLRGVGEAGPSTFYGEDRGTVLAALATFSGQLGRDPFAVEAILATLDRVLRHNSAAKAAVDMALHDLMGKILAVPLYRLFGLDRAATPRTSFTIGIDTPEVMAQKAQVAGAYPVLKVKVGTDDDEARLRAIRQVRPDAVIRVDANAAWAPRQAIQSIQRLAAYDLEFVEQPVAAGDLEGLCLVRQNSPLPIFADESCVVAQDIPRVADAVDGIVIKLMKCGGPRRALEMIHVARAHNLKVMLGCMVESSVGITAAAHLSPLVDYADLDGNLLLKNDPFEGVRVEQGRLVLPQGPGLGVERRGR